MSEYETPPWDIEQPEEPEPENLQHSNNTVADLCSCASPTESWLKKSKGICIQCDKPIIEQD